MSKTQVKEIEKVAEVVIKVGTAVVKVVGPKLGQDAMDYLKNDFIPYVVENVPQAVAEALNAEQEDEDVVLD